ncbi:hypothetical protein [Methylibium sp.]|uniref:hypothetical protein n=1 Tax=Methylibium sp. TaxID=2067992 RepID=UPI0025FE2D63|nr:hypothetical protein [Methylibium sp.]
MSATAGTATNEHAARETLLVTVAVVESGYIGSYVEGARVNVLGFAFEEHCADIRNSKVMDIIADDQASLQECGLHVRRL